MAERTTCGDNAVDFLVVSVPSVPREPVPKSRVGLKDPLEDQSFDDDPQVDDNQSGRDLVRSQLDEDGRHVSRCLAAPVNQEDVCTWNGNALLEHLHNE